MKVLYRNGDTYIVKVRDDVYYYGDGMKINVFGQNAVLFLRYNPYLQDVSGQKIEIPDHITKEIERRVEQYQEGMEGGDSLARGSRGS